MNGHRNNPIGETSQSIFMITSKKRHSRNSNTSQGDNKSTSDKGIQPAASAVENYLEDK